MDSNIFANVEIIEIGLEFDAFDLSPSLTMGNIKDFFQISGKIP